MQQPDLKQDPAKLPSQKAMDTFVKTKEGVIFQVIPHDHKKGFVFLRLYNKFIERTYVSVKQDVVNGKLKAINEHEWKEWVKKDNAHMLALSERIVKRVLLSQLLLELDDELQADFEGDQYVRNVLEKSKKLCERLISKNYEKLYNTDKTYVTNFLNIIDELVGQCSKLNLVDFVHVNTLLEKYIENPEAYQEKTVQLTKLDA